MNTGELKYQSGQEKSRLKPRNVKKPLLSRVPYKTLLTPEEQDLLRVTSEAREEWIEVSTNFEHVCDELLVDYYTYRLKACEARYDYFIRLAKEKGLTRYF